MKFKKPLLVILFFHVVFFVCGQNFSVTGTVTDKDSRKPIDTAVVYLFGSDGSKAQTKTDQSGRYTFYKKPDSSQYIKSNTTYLVTVNANAEQYFNFPDTITFSTVGANNIMVWQEDFELVKAELNRSYRIPRVVFCTDSFQIRPSSLDSLNHLVKFLKANPGIKIQLSVHIAPGDDNHKHSMSISQARAQSCVNYLISQGIDSARLVPKGWGYTQPIPGFTPADVAKMKTQKEKDEADAINRRVEFRILSFNYKK